MEFKLGFTSVCDDLLQGESLRDLPIEAPLLPWGPSHWHVL